jgi:hypothetical protein
MTGTVGALHYLRRKRRIPSGGAEYFLEEAMPDRRFAMVYFNDHRCGSFVELRSTIVKARDDAERERAAAAVERWLLAELEQDRPPGKQPATTALRYLPRPQERIAASVSRSLVPSTTTGRP